MATADVVNTVAAETENVMTKIFEIHSVENDQLYGRVKATQKVEKISRYLLRWVLERWIGGNFAKVDMNGAGLMPVGTQMNLTYLLAGFFTSMISYRLTFEQLNQKEQIIADIPTRQMAKAIISQQAHDDVTFAQSGTGILTGSSSAITNSGSATMTFAGATDTLGIKLLFEGMCVSVWDTTGATERAAGTAAPIIITAIDFDARTATLNQTVTGLTAGDIIAFRAMATYGPSALTSFASTYPGTQGASTGGGIGGDSFRHGYPYFTDTTTSNYFFSKLKSTIPQLNPVRVNAAGDSLQWEHGMRLIAKIKQKRPQQEAWKKLEGIAHSTQKTSDFELGMSIAQNMRTGAEFGPSYDGVPKGQENATQFVFAGIPINESTRQDSARIDFVNFDLIGRAEAWSAGPFELVQGKTQYEVRDPTTGQVMTAMDWAFQSAYENVCFENGSFGRIDTLAPPSATWDVG